MKLIALCVFLISAHVAVAQPVWSPEVRAQRENKWMSDNMHLSHEKLRRAYGISLDYYRQLDKYVNNQKMQETVMHKKDAEMKPLLTKEQYRQYYQREEDLRQKMKVKYTGPHQPE
jgi:hypothetical protein